MATSKGVAVHIGLNAVNPRHYGGWDGELVACEADARDMAAIAKQRRFTSRTLLTRQATRRAVLSAIDGAARSLKAGDIFFLTYSGHGGQLPDQNGDEPDMEDETWCLYDGELLDDELYEAWARFAAGVRILVLSDSCHSGSVTRALYRALDAGGGLRAVTGGRSTVVSDEPPRFRAMPPEVALRTYERNRKFYDTIGAKADPKARQRLKATVMLISGCHDSQLSSDGDFNGLFTGRLRQVWADGRFAGSYRDFHKAIVKKMPPTQVPEYSVIGAPSAGFEAQVPFTLAAPGRASGKSTKRVMR